jgi:hypothetical protein
MWLKAALFAFINIHDFFWNIYNSFKLCFSFIKWNVFQRKKNLCFYVVKKTLFGLAFKTYMMTYMFIKTTSTYILNQKLQNAWFGP